MKQARTHLLFQRQLLNGRPLNQVRRQISSPAVLHVCASLFKMFLLPFFYLFNSDSLRTESSVTLLKVSKQHVPASFPPHETHKTNGHPVTTCTSKPCPSLRLGRPLYVRAQRSPRCVLDCNLTSYMLYNLFYSIKKLM